MIRIDFNRLRFQIIDDNTAVAGMLARGAGRIPRRRYAQASSPEEGMADLDAPLGA